MQSRFSFAIHSGFQGWFGIWCGDLIRRTAKSELFRKKKALESLLRVLPTW